MSKKPIIVLIYHHHKLLDLIYVKQPEITLLMREVTATKKLKMCGCL
jgi:hypothetical protein